MVKNPPANAGDLRDTGSITESGRSPGGGPGNSLQYSCLENPMDSGAWLADLHKVVKSQTRPWDLAHTFFLHVQTTVLSEGRAPLLWGVWVLLAPFHR